MGGVAGGLAGKEEEEEEDNPIAWCLSAGLGISQGRELGAACWQLAHHTHRLCASLYVSRLCMPIVAELARWRHTITSSPAPPGC